MKVRLWIILKDDCSVSAYGTEAEANAAWRADAETLWAKHCGGAAPADDAELCAGLQSRDVSWGDVSPLEVDLPEPPSLFNEHGIYEFDRNQHPYMAHRTSIATTVMDAGEHLFTLPGDFPAGHIGTAIDIFYAGQRKGERSGRFALQAEFKRTMGL